MIMKMNLEKKRKKSSSKETSNPPPKTVKTNQKKFSGRNETKNICNHFLKAVEGGKYGWFWNCPNGKECKYRHALPPGYVLKKDRERVKEFDDGTVPITV